MHGMHNEMSNEGQLPAVDQRHHADDGHRRTPRQSSMRVGMYKGPNKTKEEADPAFMTQPNDLVSMNAKLPQPSRTGGQLHRQNKSMVQPQSRYNSFAPNNYDDQLVFEI